MGCSHKSFHSLQNHCRVSYYTLLWSEHRVYGYPTGKSTNGTIPWQTFKQATHEIHIDYVMYCFIMVLSSFPCDELRHIWSSSLYVTVRHMWNHLARLSPHVCQPEDILHPDCQLGRLADVDVFIHSATQPARISFAASCAGVAAATGEVAKNTKNLAIVEKAGSAFISLVVRSGRYLLSILHSIVDRTTICSDI